MSSWVEKYRQKQLKNIIGQNNIIYTLRQLLNKDIIIPNLLFYGIPGTGKTSTILALCYELFGPDNFKERVLNLNASDDRGIDVIRENVLNFAKKCKPKECNPRVLFCSLTSSFPTKIH